MNPKLKVVSLLLGALASILLVTQLVMGLLIVRGGGGWPIEKLIKAHQHSGYLTVSVALVYVGVSLAAIVATPRKLPGASGLNRD